MKSCLWAFTLLGLFPLVAFSVLHVTSCIVFRRAVAQEIDDSDGSTRTVGIATYHPVSTWRPVVVAPHAWPALLVLFGAVLCLVGLFFLIPRQPIQVEKLGYKRFERLLHRVYSSSADHPTLIVSARSENEALLVMRGDDGWELGLSQDSRNQDVIARIKEYFSRSEIGPTEDYRTYDDIFKIETTHLTFPLSGDASVDATTCVEVFRDVIGITDDEPMQFDIDT